MGEFVEEMIKEFFPSAVGTVAGVVSFPDGLAESLPACNNAGPELAVGRAGEGYPPVGFRSC